MRITSFQTDELTRTDLLASKSKLQILINTPYLVFYIKREKRQEKHIHLLLYLLIKNFKILISCIYFPVAMY